ncbi:MAG: hypothetical protein KDJ36_18820 [Hyphomicrobiaceae bacterium]|nr:hypothetical protein [Hyphomicrobiaceae bacterium]
MDDSEERTQGVRDVATVLPFLAVVLLTSPLIVVFSAPTTVFGIPLIVVYLFSVWIVVILVALVVAHRLSAASRNEGGTM